ncbi:GP161-like protein [Mya arenaria]|uniref:GP161-like protein n=1 Tax=Mya arenaria TaxID=6604 RepID=A0ABY7DXP2_MYAAR|nr:GP161-like protein [Mya arenaria]
MSNFHGNRFVRHNYREFCRIHFCYSDIYKRPVLLKMSMVYICNIMHTVALMPFLFTLLIFQECLFGYCWCQVSGFGMNLIFTAITFTLVLIAFDRYLAVSKQLYYTMAFASRRAFSMIASSWIEQRRQSSAQILIHTRCCSRKTGPVLWRRDERKAALTCFICGTLSSLFSNAFQTIQIVLNLSLI